ncbi:ribosome small subunit-dependent GTPase A [Oceanispirochaeta sp.]|jgi:ribosome biogenesis GTPase|uniref:ribosome small subunit-dependent GTPase A n=1 Tax=Oceanispirochaeta sp. TaxID=2035350 RepID=UPI0026046E21|nr:ribosome small subunit-dependent GTPase A [Oceanispirochaeta sp.]MDA3955556.1 ribosome small subunit-dependent GTPase A [Oceanispirochaeta sp.]
MKGLVLWGINNIFSVKGEEDGRIRECRIKGKKMDFETRFYNPLSAGDWVEFEDIAEENKGMLISRYDRMNYFARWNKKGRALQTLAVNMETLYCIVSPESPPFRPRFIDRALILAEQGHLDVAVILNKSDQNIPDWVTERLDNFKSLGLEVRFTSCETGDGIDSLREEIKGKIVGFAGQSGVGKSTLLNLLIPGASQRTAEVSEKMCRGKHTTNFAVMIPYENEAGYIIDTPGIRDLLLWGIESPDLSHWFPEFNPLNEECSYKGCRHLHEPRCAIKKAVEDKIINSDRYESYTRMMKELVENEQKY